MNRRKFLRACGRTVILGSLAAIGGSLLYKDQISGTLECSSAGTCSTCPSLSDCSKPQAIQSKTTLWQIDPRKCVQCGQCATNCVLSMSAVKCVHSFPMCGYCQLCFGYFQPGANALTKSAENQICPTGAIVRKFIEEPYFQYTIDESLCNGCGKCVAGCTTFGNGSLHLQVMHDRCLNCNECAIARACPGNAFSRVPANQAYMLKHTLS